MTDLTVADLAIGAFLVSVPSTEKLQDGPSGD